jgi:predicted CopG family antitoxin
MIKRVTISVHDDVYFDLVKIAGKEQRPLSYILNSLIQKSLKEKNRKRGKKQNNTEHNS